MYGDNELLLKKAIEKYGREKFFIATKVPPLKISRNKDGSFKRVPIKGTPDHIKKSC